MSRLAPASLRAARMRSYRRRRRYGIKSLQIQVGQGEIEALIAMGYLARGNREDREAIHGAVIDFLRDKLVQPPARHVT